MSKILVADDERAICDAFARLLALDGHKTVVASTGHEAVAAFTRENPDLVFLDVQMPDMSGLDALAQIRGHNPGVPVIIITAHGTIETAMKALERGAFDYLGKPLDLPQVRGLLQRALHQPKTATTNSAPPAEAGADQLIGSSKAMQEIFKMVSLLVNNDLTVLLTGETGVGKDLVARSIHRNGPRKKRPFVAVNCAAIPEHLIESELFGHERGAFTGAHAKRIGRFEAAGEGTIFLDEISELPFHVQAKLLRVLQDQVCEPVGSSQSIRVRARVIAATNHRFDLESSEQSFRKDLYYRLSLVNLRIPPLREHIEDVPELAQHFLEQASRIIDRDVRSIEPAAIKRLQQHSWPGNVRELQHTIQRSVLMTRRDVLTVPDLVFDESLVQPALLAAPERRLEKAAQLALSDLIDNAESPHTQPYRYLVELVERALVTEALTRNQGNQVAAADLLGINRTTLRKKV